MRILTILIIGFLLTACSDPIVGIPGGKLRGHVKEMPERWTSVPDVVQLEVRSAAPYSINIWAVVDDGKLYVATQDTKWVPMIAADNQVRIRIDKDIYELSAALVDNQQEVLSVAARYAEKYDYDANEDVDWSQGARLYRLAAR